MLHCTNTSQLKMLFMKLREVIKSLGSSDCFFQCSNLQKYVTGFTVNDEIRISYCHPDCFE